MDFEATPIPGAFLIRPKVFEDERGTFVKVFHQPTFSRHGLDFRPAECFYSTSRRDVLRGMHFQLPPVAQDKLVYCTGGRVLDVLLDLRRGSPTEGKSFATELSARSPLSLFIPLGVAHGFLALEDDSVLEYSVTTPHDPASDAGVRWDSFGMNWPIGDPLVSKRDSSFPSLAEFESPFVFQP